MEIINKEFCSCCAQMKKVIYICNTDCYLCGDCLRDAAHKMDLPVFPQSEFFNDLDRKIILFLLQNLSTLNSKISVDDITGLIYSVTVQFESDVITWTFNDTYKIEYLPESNELKFYVDDVLYSERTASGA